eukprot:29383-Pyramimonas_sp.AAC.1
MSPAVCRPTVDFGRATVAERRPFEGYRASQLAFVILQGVVLRNRPLSIIMWRNVEPKFDSWVGYQTESPAQGRPN